MMKTLRNASLTLRLTGFVLLGLIVLLPSGGALLGNAYRRSAEHEFTQQMETLLRTLVAVTESDGNGVVQLIRPLGDSRFEQIYSGWYWQVSEPSGRLLRSRSLWESRLPTETGHDGVLYRRDITGPGGGGLLVLERDVWLDGMAAPLHFTVAAATSEAERRIAEFHRLLWITSACFGAGLLLLVLLQVRFGLRPLQRLADDLEGLRKGEARRLSDGYPHEVMPLVGAMNALLQHDETLIAGARAHLGNLAHALKTPLAVLQVELRDMPARQQLTEQIDRMARLVDYHLARAAAAAGAGPGFGRKTLLRPLIDEIAAALAHIQPDRQLKIHVLLTEGLAYPGAADDLQEMVGNLLENAWKWAKMAIHVRGEIQGGHLRLDIEDDGPGLSDADMQEATRRGIRLDQGTPGSGLGLSIVSDLCQLYGGELTLRRAQFGGLRATLSLPLPAALPAVESAR